MRRFPHSWDTLRTKLGFRKAKTRRSIRRHRLSQMEPLEIRAYLSGDPVTTLDEQAIVEGPVVTSIVFQSQATYVLTNITPRSENEAEEIGRLREMGLEDVLTSADLFLVATEQTPEGPKAVVRLNSDMADRAPGGLQTLKLELQLDGQVLETYEILVDIAEEPFRTKFLNDRIEAVREKSAALSSEEQFTRLATKRSDDPLAEEGRRLVGFVGPLTSQQELARAKYDESRNADRTPIELAEVSTDELGIRAIDVSRKVESLRPEVELANERAAIYAEVQSRLMQMTSSRLAAVSETAEQQSSEDMKALQELGLLILKDLVLDMASENVGLKAAAQGLRDELVAIGDIYHTAFTGLGVDHEVQRTVTSQGDLMAYALVESGYYGFDEHVAVDLAGQPAMVQVTRLNPYPYSSLITVEESPAVEDGHIIVGSPPDALGPVLATVNLGTGTVETLVRFNLGSTVSAGPVLASDIDLRLVETYAISGEVQVLAWKSILPGGPESPSDWDETNLSWDRIYSTLDLDNKLNQFELVDTWEVGSTTSLDLSAQARRTLLYGDANGNGIFDPGGMAGDIEAFHLAVVDWDAYVAEYGPRAHSLADLLARTDGGLGDGIINTDDVPDFLRRFGRSAGDFNLDGTVNGVDWSIYQSSYDTSNIPLPNARFGQGDANFDGIVNAADFPILDAENGSTGLTPVTPELMLWLRPADANSGVVFASQEHTSFDGPALEVNNVPDLVINDFTVSGTSLRVDYSVLGEALAGVTVQLFKEGSSTPLYTSATQSGALGARSLSIAASVLSTVVEGDVIYAKVTPTSGTQSNTANDRLNFEFSTAADQIVNSLDDAGMDTLLRSTHTLRELIEVNNVLGWFDTITFDPGLFADGAQRIVLGDHNANGIADAIGFTKDIEIVGPGAHLLAISGNQQSQVFSMASGAIRLEGLAIEHGYGYYGGGITSATDLTLDGVVVRNNQSTWQGGGLRATSGELVILDSTFVGNTAVYGGGIWRDPGTTGDFTRIESSTFHDNDAIAVTNVHQGNGAGLSIGGSATSEFQILNSTISGNRAVKGGGLIVGGTIHVDIVNSTIAYNQAFPNGASSTSVVSAGGIHHANPNLTLHNTIVAGNTSTSSHSPNLWHHVNAVPLNSASSYNLIEANPSGGATGGLTSGGTNQNIIVAKGSYLGLSPLDYYGGPTKTHLVLANSPAVDAGSDAIAEGYGLLLDQRGFTRFYDVVGMRDAGENLTDIGAYEDPDIIVNNLGDIGTEGQARHPGELTLRAALKQASQLATQGLTPRIVFDPRLFEDGPQEIVLEDSSSPFDGDFDSLPDQLFINFDVTIEGPGADLLSIRGRREGSSKQTRVVHVYGYAGDADGTGGEVEVSISGLTLTEGGGGSAGGGIYLGYATLMLDQMRIVDNSSYWGGGVYNYLGHLTIKNSEISENHAELKGGGIFNQPLTQWDPKIGSLLIENTTISGNTSTSRGAGIYGLHNTTILSSTITDNHIFGPDVYSGGIYGSNYDGDSQYPSSAIPYPAPTIVNSIIAGNWAGSSPLPSDAAGTWQAGTRDNNLWGAFVLVTFLGGPWVEPTSTYLTEWDGSDLHLAPLDYNGGSTRSHALMPGSLAIDAGNSDLNTDSDQRGVLRGVLTDIGAVEFDYGDVAPRLAPIPPQHVVPGNLLAVVLEAEYVHGILNDIQFSNALGNPENVVLTPILGQPGKVLLEWQVSSAVEAGTYTLEVDLVDTVSPWRRNRETITVTVGPPNQLPVWAGSYAASVVAGVEAVVYLSATDPDGSQHQLRYAKGMNAPANVRINPVTGALTWTTTTDDIGSHTFEVVVTDGGNPAATSVTPVHIDVLAPNLTPLVTAPATILVAEDSQYVFNSVGTPIFVGDPDGSDAEVLLAIVVDSGTVQLAAHSGVEFLQGTGGVPSSRLLLRGAPSALNAALNGLTFVAQADFFGVAELRLELSDLGNGGTHASAHAVHSVLIEVTPVLDVPSIAAQSLYVNAEIFSASDPYWRGIFGKAGRVNATNPDPQGILNYSITAGNGSGRFTIDKATGEISVANVSSIAQGTAYPLTVRVEYEDYPSLFDTATLTIYAESTSNQSPQAFSEIYDVDEDQVLVGNVLLGDAFGGVGDSDPENGPLFLKRVSLRDGTDFELGKTITVEGGARLTVNSDGSFTYDPSVSDEFDRGIYPNIGDNKIDGAFWYEVSDNWGRTVATSAEFQIIPVNDLHSADAQVFSVVEGAAQNSLVGTVRVRNVEKTDALQFSIAGGNTGDAFAIGDNGVVSVKTPGQLSTSQLYHLQVEVTDSVSRTISVAVDIHVGDNQPPAIVGRLYRTAEDALLIGDLIADAGQGGVLVDPDGQPLEVVALRGRAEDVGRAIQLPSGATVTVEPSGQFQYDPSSSAVLNRLNAGAVYPDVFSVIVRDALGAESEIPVTISVTGRNDSPVAVSLAYSTTHNRTLTGNLLADEGLDGAVADVDVPEVLRVNKVDGSSIAGHATVVTRLGATLTVHADGTFEYDPSTISGVNQLPLDEIVYDAFLYEIMDASNERPATGVVRVSVTRTPNSLTSDLLHIDQFELASDTGESPDDRITSDPTFVGHIAGLVAGAHDYLIEFNLDASGTSSNSTIAANASYVVLPGSTGFPTFEFDPTTSLAFSEEPGPKVIAYRVSARNSAGTILTQAVTDESGLGSNVRAQTDWQYFRFTLEDASNAGPIRLVDELRPLEIPLTVDEESGTVTAGNTISDPRLVGVVHGDFSGREVRIEYNYVRNGIPCSGSVTMSAAGQFLIDLTTVDPGLVNTGDTFTVSYNTVIVDTVGSDPDEVGDPLTLEVSYEPRPVLNAYVNSMAEATNQQEGYFGDSRRIEGNISWGYQASPLQEEAFVEFDYSDALGQFDGIPDGETLVVLDGASAPYSYSHLAIGLQGAQPQIRGRVREWLPEKGAFAYGIWSDGITLDPVSAPDIASVGIIPPTAGNRTAPAIAGYLEGAAIGGTEGTIPSQTDLSGVGFVTIQFFHGSGSLEPSSVPDGTVLTDAIGHFTYQPQNLEYGGTTVQVRTVVQVDNVGTTVYGDPYLVSVSLSQPELPPIDADSLEVLDEQSEQQYFDKLRWVTTDPSIQGVLNSYENTVPFGEVEIELAHDYLNVSGDENVVVGYATVDATGKFTYRPYDLVPGDVTIRARVSYFDPATNDYFVTPWDDWKEIALHLESAENTLATVVDVQLVGDDDSVLPHVKQVTITGRVVNPDGPVAHTVVQFDTDANPANGILGSTITNAAGEFTFIPTGLTPSSSTITIRARAADWDYATRQQVFGPWSAGENQLAFVLDPLAPLEVVSGSLRLASDTGASSTDGITANPMVEGRIDGDAALAGVAIAIDVGNNGSVDAIVETDGEGHFSYLPVGLSTGTQAIRARVATWNSATNTYTYSTGVNFSFTLQSQVNAAATIPSLQLKTPPSSGPAADATLVGRIANEGSLAGIVVEFDFDTIDGNGINQSTTTDALGRFELSPAQLSAGSVSIRARTREIDAATGNVLVGAWKPITFTYQPVDNPGPALGSMEYTLSSGSPQIYGYLSGEGITENIIVEFSHTENGPVIGTVSANASGYYHYDLGELQTGQQYTIWARAKEVVKGAVRYSEPSSETFTFAPWGNVVTSFALAADTSNGGTSTSSDGSTEDATLVGQIDGPDTVAGVYIYFYADTDTDGVRDDLVGQAVTDSFGEFVFPYSPTSSGFFSIQARIGQYYYAGTTRVANFVYDADDSSPQALALTNAFSAVDSQWQESAEFSGLAAGSLADAVYATAASNATGDFDFSVALAEYQRKTAQTAAEVSYAQERTAAEAAYKLAVDQAQAAFVLALNALPVGDRAAFDLEDFVWPGAPDDNALSLPSHSSLRQPPASPRYTGPTFDAANDPLFLSQVAVAERTYAAAVREARSEFEEDKQDADEAYQSDVADAMATYADAVKAAGDTLEALQADDPEFDSVEYRALVDRISAAWREYQHTVDSNSERYTNVVQAAEDDFAEAEIRYWLDRGNALDQAWDEAFDGDWESYEGPEYTDWEENSPPERETYEKAAYQIVKRFAEQREKVKNTYAEALANARREQAQANAAALQDALEEVYDALRDMAQLSRDYRHAQTADNAADQYEFATLLAAAREQLATELATAAAVRDKLIADHAYDRDEAIADAARDREQAISTARLTSTEAWAQATGTIWSTYQAQLATNADNYNQAVADSGYDRDVAVAAAQKSAAYVVADANETKATAIATAEYARTIALAEKLTIYVIETDAVYTTRDKALADLWYEYRVERSLVRESYAIDVADIQAEYGVWSDGESAGIWSTYDTNPYYWSEGIQQSKARNEYEATLEGAYDIQVLDWFDVQWRYELDNSGTRLRAHDAFYRKLAEITRDGAMAREDAEEALDHGLIDALETYRQQAATVVRDAAVGVSDNEYDYQTGVAGIQHTYHVGMVQAAAEHAVKLTRAEAIEDYGIIAANAGFDADESGFARTLQISNVVSQNSYEISEATGYLSNVTTWAAAVPARWGAYQVDLAEAELARVNSIGGARLTRATGLGNASVAWTSVVVGADLAYDAILYGGVNGGGALVARSQTIADAHVTIAENSSLEAYVTAQSEAVRSHDQGVAGANRTLRHEIARLDAERDREVSSATHDYHRAIHQLYYEFRKSDGLTPWGPHGSRADLEAQKTRDIRVAKANEVRAVGIAEARRDWTSEVGDLNVAFVEDLVGAQQDRAAALRDEIITLAAAVSSAQATFLTTEASAIQQHVTTTVGADATSRTTNAGVEATYATSVTSVLNVKSEADATALGVYEVGMYADHAAATAAYHTAQNSRLSLYQKLVAAADHTWVIAKAAARNLYHDALSAIETSQTAQRNAAYLGEAQSSAAANKAYAIGQAAVDRSFAVTNAGADAALYLAKKTAEADLIVAATDAQGAADIAYAKAVRDRDNAYADANVAWVKTTAAAYASLVVGDIDWPEYNDIVAAADETRARAKEAAAKAFERAIDEAGTKQVEELGAARLAYVEAVGSAKVNHTQVTASADVTYATGSAQGDNRLVAELSKAAETQENLLRTADYNQNIALIAEDVAYETLLRDAGATLAGSRGLAEGNYHLAQAQADATSWGNASAAAPGDDYLRFKAVEAASRATWFAALTGAYATFRSLVAYSEGQASVDLALVRESQETQRGLATLNYQKSASAAERQRTIARATAENAGYVESVRHESSLAVDIALAEYDYGNAYAEAVVNDEMTRDSIERDDLTEGEETEALKDATYALAVALASAKRDWQLDVSGAEFRFASAEANTEHNVLDRLAGVESRFSVAHAQGEAMRDVNFAIAEQDKLVDQAVVENTEREARTVAAANFQSEKLEAATDALDDLVLAMPRAEGQIHGIAVGYADGDLVFTPNVYGGTSDVGEFAVSGTSFTRHTSAGGTTSSLGTLGGGVAVSEGATGTGYLMFSVASIHTRFSANAPKNDNAVHLVAVRYSGGQWQYNNDAGWFAFTQATGDVLLAEVDFDADSVYGLGGYLPWAEYERDRAAAEEAAWAAVKDDFLGWQEDVSTAYLTYASIRGAHHVDAVTNMAGVHITLANQSASEIESHVGRSANIQQAFGLTVAELTSAYRTSVAQAQYAYAMATAEGIREGDSQQQYDASTARNNALSAAEQDFHEGYSAEDAARRIDLAASHFQLIATTAGDYLEASYYIAGYQATYDEAVHAAYYSPSGGVDSLEETLAQLEYDYLLAAAAHKTSAYEDLAVSNTSPWADLAEATTTADETYFTGPLAQQQSNRRLALVGAEVDAELAQNAAARDRQLKQATAERSLAVNNAAALLNSARATAEDGSLPDDFTAPTPDLGSITVVSNNYALVQPGAIGDELWYYGWGDGWSGWYGYGSYYSDDYGPYDVSSGNEGLVGGLNASSGGEVGLLNGGSGAAGIVGGIPGYYGGWDYLYGPFSWGGWSPSYVPTPALESTNKEIDPEAEVAAADSLVKAAVVDRESKVQSVQEHVGEESLAADPEGPLHSLAAKGPELLQNDIHKWRYLSTLQCHSPSGIDTRTLDFDLNVFKAIASRGEEETTPLTAISVATVEVVQSLVNEGMAFYVTRSAVPAVHHRDEFGVGFLISPERPADSKGYVVVSDLVGNRINTAILEKVSGGYKLVWTSQNSGDWFDESQSLDYRLSVLKDVRTQRRANDFVDIFIKEPKQIAALEGIAAAGTFVLHMIPGGAFADHAAQGEWGEATLALAGDAALLVGGPLKAMAAARGWAKTARGFQLAAVSIEGTIGTVRLGQSAYAFYDGDNAQAAGYLGEAFLRLYGVKVAIKKPPVGKPEFTPPVDDVRVKPGLTGQALKSHTNAARAEEELARILHSLPDEAVVRWGDKIGKHGNDVITVNWKTGDVKLWDVKYRSGDVRVQPSKTFTDPARRANAILEAIDTLKTNTTLSPEIRDKALQNLVDGRIKYRTVGDGKAKNSILHEYL